MSNPNPRRENLMPPPKKGEIRNPTGRAKGAAYPAEWMRAMANYTTAELLRVVKNPKTPCTKIAAAQTLLAATQLEGLAAVREVADRLEGKPKQTTEHQGGLRLFNIDAPPPLGIPDPQPPEADPSA